MTQDIQIDKKNAKCRENEALGCKNYFYCNIENSKIFSEISD